MGQRAEVPSGHVYRVVTIEGPQVGDLKIWNRHNPPEPALPYLRPLATITADALADSRQGVRIGRRPSGRASS